MKLFQVYIPLLEGHAQALDLSNALTPLNGVGEVRIDEQSRVLSVQYDPDYADEATMRGCIVGSGYPIGDGTSHD